MDKEMDAMEEWAAGLRCPRCDKVGFHLRWKIVMTTPLSAVDETREPWLYCRNCRLAFQPRMKRVAAADLPEGTSDALDIEWTLADGQTVELDDD